MALVLASFNDFFIVCKTDCILGNMIQYNKGITDELCTLMNRHEILSHSK